MDIKKVSQYSLLILLIVSSFLFYYKYFTEDVKKIENNKTENEFEKKNFEIELNDENKKIYRVIHIQ